MDPTIVDERELRFTASRSSGPGGQHVNKVETRVTLHFDVQGSPSLTEDQKRRIAGRLASRINRHGVLRVASERHRTREANRRAALERFRELLAEALHVPRSRRKTHATPAGRRERLAQKRRRATLKRTRSKADGGED
jgi:ribosome-associated protein